MLPINTISFGAGAKPNGRPVQANAPDDRIPRGPGGYRLKSVCADFIPACSLVYRTILRALRMRFLRHGGIYLVRCGLLLNPNLGGRVASRQPLLPRSENASGGPHSPHRPQMSSGRLFLDRVGRHQSPSPLHRHEQNNMHSSNVRGKADISTLPESGHFYFALTGGSPRLDPARDEW